MTRATNSTDELRRRQQEQERAERLRQAEAEKQRKRQEAEARLAQSRQNKERLERQRKAEASLAAQKSVPAVKPNTTGKKWNPGSGWDKVLNQTAQKYGVVQPQKPSTPVRSGEIVQPGTPQKTTLNEREYTFTSKVPYVKQKPEPRNPKGWTEGDGFRRLERQAANQRVERERTASAHKATDISRMNDADALNYILTMPEKLTDKESAKSKELQTKIEATYKEALVTDLEKQVAAGTAHPGENTVADLKQRDPHDVFRLGRSTLAGYPGYEPSEEVQTYEHIIGALNQRNSAWASFWGGAQDTLMAPVEGVGGLIDKALGKEDTPLEQQLDAIDEAKKTGRGAQHPVANFGGALGASALEYALGTKALDALGIGGKLASTFGQTAGNLIGGTGLDIAFDTIPNAVVPGIERMQTDPAYTGGDLTKDILGNVGINTVFNIIPEVIGQAGRAGAKRIESALSPDDAAKVAGDALPTLAPDAAKSAAQGVPSLASEAAKATPDSATVPDVNRADVPTYDPDVHGILPENIDGHDFGTVRIPADKVAEYDKLLDDLPPGEVREWVRGKLEAIHRGKTVTVDGVRTLDVPYTVEITKRGIKKSTSVNNAFTAQNLATLERLDEIVQNARYHGFEPDKRARNNVLRTDQLKTNVVFEGEPDVPAVASGRVIAGNKGRNTLYYQGLENKENTATGLGAQNLEKDSGVPIISGSGSTNTIPQLDTKINTPDMTPPEQNVSKVATNTYQNTPIFSDADREMLDMNKLDSPYKYDVISERQSMARAEARVAADFDGELDALIKNGVHSGEDVDTGMKLLSELKDRAQAGDPQAIAQFRALAKQLQATGGTEAGQTVQAWAKYTRTPEGTVVAGENIVGKAQEAWAKRYPRKAKAMRDTAEKIGDIAKQYGNTGDAAEIRAAIKDALGTSGVRVKNSVLSDVSDAVAKGTYNADDIYGMLTGVPRLADDEIKQILDIETQAQDLGPYTKERADLDAQAYKIIADKIPSTLRDKWDAWRHIAMLTNPTTHVRNISGNILMRTMGDTQARLAGGLEKLINKIKPGSVERTTTGLNPLGGSDRALMKASADDFSNVYALAKGESKFTPTGEVAQPGLNAQTVLKYREPFENKALAALNKFSGGTLEAEDTAFLKSAYQDSLARYLKANGADSSIFDAAKAGDKAANDLLWKARNHAIGSAQELTFRNPNKGATVISGGIRNMRNSDNAAIRAAGSMADAAVPFVRTPMNVAKAAFNYSPLGLGKGVLDLGAIKKGTKTASEVVSEITKGLTGTGILGLGYALEKNGILTPGPSEDKDLGSYKSMLGEQDYALKIGDKTYTIDWAAPFALPLFVGAEMAALGEKGDESTLNRITQSASRLIGPITEMSMLQGVDRMFQAVRGSEEPIPALIATTATNYFTQGVPTMLGKTASTIDPTRRSTYTGKTGTENQMMKQVYAIRNKIPGLSMTGEPMVDQWGREVQNSGGNLGGRMVQNFLSPGYIASDKTTPVDTEIMRLYDATGESSVIPDYARQTYTVEGEKRNWTPEEYTAYSKFNGQVKYGLLEQVIGTPEYSALSDDLKKEVVGDAYKIADVVAQAEVNPDYVPPDSVKGIYDAYKSGVPMDSYMEYKAAARLAQETSGAKSVSSDMSAFVLMNMGLDGESAYKLYNLENGTGGVNKAAQTAQAAGVNAEAFLTFQANVGALAPEGKRASAADMNLLLYSMAEQMDEITAQDLIGLSSTYDQSGKMQMAYEGGIDPETYLNYFLIADVDGNGNIKQVEAEAALNSLGLSETEKAMLYALTNSGWKTNPYVA